MPSPLKKPESMHDIIFEAVTKKREAVQETARKCKKLFKDEKDPADPNVLIQLEEVLIARQNEEDIAKHINLSKPGTSPKTPDELKESLKKQREDYECYIQDFLPALKTEIINSKKLDKKQQAIIVEKILDITNRSSNKDHSGSTSEGDEHESGYDSDTRDNDNTNQKDPIPHTAMENNKEENLASPVSSRRSSVSSILSSIEEDNGLQSEDEGETKLAHLTKTRPKGPSGRRSPSKYNKKIEDQVKEEPAQVSLQQVTEARGEESKIPVSATQITDDDHTKDPVKSEEKEDRENATPIVQEVSNNENNSEVKQPNNRNLHVALVAGCALSTIGCIVAGAMTSGLVGAGLLAMAAVFAIAAVAELHSNFLSSKLTSINVEPLVDDKELTACSRL